MKRFKKLLTGLLTLALMAGLFGMGGTKDVQAATKPDKPVITVSETDEYGEVLVTISSTKNADGYRIYCKSNKDKKYRKLDTIAKDGTKTRKYTAKELPSGTYSFRVRAYSKASGKTVWSSYSKIAKIYVEDAATRARNERMNETAADEYPDLYALVEDGKLGLTMDDNSQIYFTLGTYDMVDKNLNYDDKKEMIEWLVLDYDEDEGKALLLSRYLIDIKPFNETYETGKICTWEECTLRTWLNEDFYSSAFNKSEQKIILRSDVRNHDNNDFGIGGGNDTKDRIFLLSEGEAKIGGYFNDINERKATLLDGTQKRWYLRSQGMVVMWHHKDYYNIAYVDNDGKNGYGEGFDTSNVRNSSDLYAVRPALWISMNP